MFVIRPLCRFNLQLRKNIVKETLVWNAVPNLIRCVLNINKIVNDIDSQRATTEEDKYVF